MFCFFLLRNGTGWLQWPISYIIDKMSVRDTDMKGYRYSIVYSDVYRSWYLNKYSTYAVSVQSPQELYIKGQCMQGKAARRSCETHIRCWQHGVRFPKLQVVMGGDVVIWDHGVLGTWTKPPHESQIAPWQESINRSCCLENIETLKGIFYREC